MRMFETLRSVHQYQAIEKMSYSSESDEEYGSNGQGSRKVQIKIEGSNDAFESILFMQSSSESEGETCESTERREEVHSVTENALPEKSRIKYDAAYNIFLDWKKKKKANISEDLLIDYFNEYMKKYKPSTVWAHYSMLKTGIRVKDDIDISKYRDLSASVKKNALGYQSEKSKLFTIEQVKKFLQEAPDEFYIVNKVVIIFGIMGCCTGEEIIQVRVQDVQEHGELLLVNVPQTKTKKPRQFAINPDMSKIVKKYLNIRPREVSTTRLFLNYYNRKFSKQPMGKNKISTVPKEIATFLKLENANLYTGHALKRTSSTSTSRRRISSMINANHMEVFQSDEMTHTYEENPLKIETGIPKLEKSCVQETSKRKNNLSSNKNINENNKDVDEVEQNCSSIPFKRVKTISTETSAVIKQISTSIEVDGIDLFNANLLERVANQLRADGLIFRPLNSKDFDKGFLQLLGQLTEVGHVSKDQFLNRFHGMKSSGGYYVIVVEDLNTGKVIGSATLVVEQKFIHSCGMRGHLEDVVVNSEYRGKQLGKLVVMAVKQLAKSLQCYKITLECRDRLIPFYESLGFKREPGNANSMHARFPHDNPAEQSRL